MSEQARCLHCGQEFENEPGLFAHTCTMQPGYRAQHVSPFETKRQAIKFLKNTIATLRSRKIVVEALEVQVEPQTDVFAQGFDQDKYSTEFTIRLRTRRAYKDVRKKL